MLKFSAQIRMYVISFVLKFLIMYTHKNNSIFILNQMIIPRACSYP